MQGNRSHMLHEKPDTAKRRYYMPDDSTQLIARTDHKKDTMRAKSIRERLYEALEKLNIDVASIYESLQHRTVETNTPNSPHHPFKHDDVLRRLYDDICAAQNNAAYHEAIRLQHLAWSMEDRQMSPIQVVREAWLKPAAYRG